jgi:hypothetical protein
MANFVDKKYESDQLGLVIQVRMGSDEAAVYGAEPTGTKDSNLHAFNGGSRRKFGVHSRGFKLKRSTGTAPNLINHFAFLPSPTTTAFTAQALDATITIGGVDWKVDSKLPETVK